MIRNHRSRIGARLHIGNLGLALAAIVLLAGCQAAKPPESHPVAFWPPYPDEPRLQYLVSYERNTDVEPPKGKLDDILYGKEANEALAINKPYGVAMWQGCIYVCDLRLGAVTILDLKKRQTRVMGKTGGEPMQSPSAIAIAPDGTKYIADVGRGLIFVYDAQDRQVRTIGGADIKPVNVAVHGQHLYVVDFKGQRVLVMNPLDGQVVRSIGGPGREDGQFVWPLGLQVDEQGNIYVMDVLKCQLQKFDREGKLLTVLGGASASAGGFVRPKHIAMDRNGHIFVVDAAFQNVQLIDQLGRPLTFFGGVGDFPGAMQMPAGISIHEGDLELFQQYVHPAFQPERLVLVTNQFGKNKVSVYAMGRLKPGKTMADISNSKGVVRLNLASTPRKGGAGGSVVGQAEPALPGPARPLPTSAPVGPVSSRQ